MAKYKYSIKMRRFSNNQKYLLGRLYVNARNLAQVEGEYRDKIDDLLWKRKNILAELGCTKFLEPKPGE